MTNTIPNVPRELKPCPFCGSKKISYSTHQIGIAVGCDSCGAVCEIKGSKEQCAEAWNTRAPSPAGVDGLEVVGYSYGDGILINDTTQPDNPMYTKLVRLSDAQAIIDGLRGEVERYRAVLNGAKYPNLDKLLSFSVEDCRFLGGTVASMTISVQSERDQQAQRIGELEQILRDLVPGCKWRFMRPRIDAALAEIDHGNE